MMTWLIRLHPTPPVFDGLLTFQITGSPIPALIALTAPMLRDRISLLSRDH